MATGVSHHIGPSGDIEPCPIIQFATRDRFTTIGSHLRDDDQARRFLAISAQTAARRPEAASSWNGPTWCATWCRSTGRTTRRSAERPWRSSRAMTPRHSQHMPGQESAGRALGLSLRQETLVLWLRRLYLKDSNPDEMPECCTHLIHAPARAAASMSAAAGEHSRRPSPSASG